MIVPEILRKEREYKKFVDKAGENFVKQVALPFTVSLIRTLFSCDRRVFWPKHSVYSEDFIYIPSNSEILSKVLRIRDQEFLQSIRNTLTVAIPVSVYIDQMKIKVSFEDDVVVINHPYLIRLRERSKVIFHVLNHSITLEIK